MPLQKKRKKSRFFGFSKNVKNVFSNYAVQPLCGRVDCDYTKRETPQVSFYIFTEVLTLRPYYRSIQYHLRGSHQVTNCLTTASKAHAQKWPCTCVWPFFIEI